MRSVDSHVNLLGVLAAGFVAMATTGTLQAQNGGSQPNWWTERGMVDSDQQQDLAIALVGQGKAFAVAARNEMDEKLTALGGAGEALEALIESDWFVSTASDRAPLLLGQLKTLAAPVYRRLQELNLQPSQLPPGHMYPWSVSTLDDADTAPATVGQLKAAFAFDLDVDADSLPDWWEQRVVNSMELSAAGDADGDGLSNAREMQTGTHPLLADTDGDTQLDGIDESPLVYDPPPPVPTGRLEVATAMVPEERSNWMREEAQRLVRGLEPREYLDRDWSQSGAPESGGESEGTEQPVTEAN